MEQQTTKVLVIPEVYKKDINPHSGFLPKASTYGKKNLKGLFRAPENIEYLSEQIWAFVSRPQYVQLQLSGLADELDRPEKESDNYVASDVKYGYKRPTLRGTPFRGEHVEPSKRALRIARSLNSKKNDIYALTPEMAEDFVLPYAEDTQTLNPIMELHHVNMDFIIQTANVLLQNPDMLDARMRDWNPDTGNFEGGPGEGKFRSYEYNNSSWNDGTWHPEHLFTESASNRKTAYWEPKRTEFNNSPYGYPQDPDGIGSDGGRGPGNKYKHQAVRNLPSDLGVEGLQGEPSNLYELIANDPRGVYPTAGPDRPQQGSNARMRLFSNGGQFPFWQTRVHDRPIERDNSEALREGGDSDRRVQSGRGYDMSKLTKRSTSRK